MRLRNPCARRRLVLETGLRCFFMRARIIRVRGRESRTVENFVISLEAFASLRYNERSHFGCGNFLPTVDTMSLEWSRAVENLKDSLGVESVERWISPLKPTSVSDQSVVLEAPDQFFKDWVLAHYEAQLRECAGGREVQIVSAPEPLRHPDVRPPAVADGPLGLETPLNPKFTFDRFVVGLSNRFAHAASLAVAESPAKAYNPLFLYGGVGLGKTHLMQAIAHRIFAKNPQKKPLFSQQERIELARQVLQAIHNVAVEGFDCLLTEFAKKCQADIILRGLRAVSDFEYEFQLAGMNRYLSPQIETVFLAPADKYMFVSSTLVKEIALLNGDIRSFVHPLVANALQIKAKTEKNPPNPL